MTTRMSSTSTARRPDPRRPSRRPASGLPRAAKALAAALAVAAALVAGSPAVTLSGQEPATLTYAIAGARVVPVSGAPIDNAIVVFRDGLITDVGQNVAVPAGAVRIDGKGLTVYPGLVDMGTTAGIVPPEAPRTDNLQTREEVERVKRSVLLRPQFEAAAHIDPEAQPLARAAASGITSVLATPAGDAIRGQSALINTTLGPAAPQIGAVAAERRGRIVVRSPVALHVSFASRPGGGNAYPNSLMGVIAFVRQAFLDAQHYEASHQYVSRVPRGTARPLHDPALEALAPALAGRLPVAFEAETHREILRALDMAAAFRLTPIITHAREADQAIDDLRKANARVIVSLHYPKRPASLAPDADEPLSVLRARINAPKTPAALAKAGITFAFGSGGLDDPKEFIANARKAVEDGLAREAALRALTLNAATIAGVADRLGSIEAGKVANLLVTEGDLFDEQMTVKHVFVDGRPVDLDAAGARGSTRRQTR